MESIKRVVMMLKSDNATPATSGNTAVLKLQSARGGLIADLAVPSLPSQLCPLYLFDNKGDDYFAGNIQEGRLHTELSTLSLDSVAGAAVTYPDSLTFLLKSQGLNWTDIAARFKFKYTPPKLEAKPSEPAEIKPPEPEEPFEAPAELPMPSASRHCDSCPHVIRQDKINPFPTAFPNSEWVKISYPGPTGWWHYISGKILSGEAVIIKVLGVPGEYGMAPPIWLEGFGTYMRSAIPEASGYWLMFQDAETGEVLDMGLSPHDG